LRSEFWTWKDFKLVLSGFLILRLYTGSDLIEMELKIKEQVRERVELLLTFNLDSFGEFIEDLKKINSKVEKKGDFRDKVLEYNLFSTSKIQTGLYFDKSDWRRFYQFLENCYKEIIEQAREYRELTKGE